MRSTRFCIVIVKLLALSHHMVTMYWMHSPYFNTETRLISKFVQWMYMQLVKISPMVWPVMYNVLLLSSRASTRASQMTWKMLYLGLRSGYSNASYQPACTCPWMTPSSKHRSNCRKQAPAQHSMAGHQYIFISVCIVILHSILHVYDPEWLPPQSTRHTADKTLLLSMSCERVSTCQQHLLYI